MKILFNIVLFKQCLTFSLKYDTIYRIRDKIKKYEGENIMKKIELKDAIEKEVIKRKMRHFALAGGRNLGEKNSK